MQPQRCISQMICKTPATLLMPTSRISHADEGFKHLHLILLHKIAWTITNETFKWREYVSLKKKLSEAKASAAALKAGISSEPKKKSLAKRKCLGICGRSSAYDEDAEAKAEAINKRNLYNRGSFQNLSQIGFQVG